jgi:8-oxo-dGTP pyrophosphatase MutT (NUDIX family)
VPDPSIEIPLPTLPASSDLGDRFVDLLAARERTEGPASGRPAAVLIPIFDRDNQPHIFLTKRASTLSEHPGQISLPGGRRDPEDRDITATALREAHEELGIPPHAVTVLGSLDDVQTYQSSFTVTPVVGVLPTRPTVAPNPREIARVMEVSLAEILAIDERLPADASIAELRYPLDGEDVWGATARILRAFCALTRDAIGHHTDHRASDRTPGQ